MMKYAGVKYLSSKKSKTYDYVTIEGVDIGDIVVVPTQFGVSIAQVVELRDTAEVSTMLQIRHVISEGSPILKEKRDAVQRNIIHQKIKARITEKIENAQYEEYAKHDPVIRDLADKLKTMQ